MQIYIIRHTPVELHHGTCYGQSDVAVNDTYEQQLAHIKQQLLAARLQHIYSSPLQRCRQLAEQLAKHFQLAPPILQPQLMEMNFGAWELMRWDDIELQQLELWSQNLLDYAPPGGECLAAMAARVRDFYQALLRRPQDGNCAVVTHAGVMRIIIADLLGLPLQQIFDPRYKINLGYSAVLQLDISRAQVSRMLLNGLPLQ